MQPEDADLSYTHTHTHTHKHTHLLLKAMVRVFLEVGSLEVAMGVEDILGRNRNRNYPVKHQPSYSTGKWPIMAVPIF